MKIGNRNMICAILLIRRCLHSKPLSGWRPHARGPPLRNKGRQGVPSKTPPWRLGSRRKHTDQPLRLPAAFTRPFALSERGVSP
jgi:hypothetical protein